MPRWVLIVVTAIAVLTLGGTAGWYAYQNTNYVKSGYAYVTSPYAWVAASESGQITKVLVLTGQHVLRGQPLFDERVAGKAGLIAVNATANGVVGNINVTLGSVVESGEDLCTVVNLSNPHVVAEVPESQARNVSLSQSVDVHFSEEPGQVYRGTVTHIGAVTLTTLSPILRTGTFAKEREWVPVTITLMNSPGNLRDGENASIRIHI
jgi:multidrug resistance efflux pump